MGRAYNFSRFFLISFFIFCCFCGTSSGAMSSGSAWRKITADELAELQKGPFKDQLSRILHYRNKQETMVATVDDIEINAATGLFRWIVPAVLAYHDQNFVQMARNQAMIAARTELNTYIAAHHTTHTKAETLAEENARLKAQVEELLVGLDRENEILALRDTITRLQEIYRHETTVLKTQILSLTEMLGKHGIHIAVNVDATGPGLIPSKGAVVAANPFIGIIEGIQNNLNIQLRGIRAQNETLLKDLTKHKADLAEQITENNRLKKERDEWQDLAELRLTHLHLKQNEIDQLAKETEIKWNTAMQMQNKLIQDLAAANHRLTEKERVNPDGMAMLDAMSPSGKAIAHVISTSPQLEKGKVKKLAEKLANKKEELKAEHRKNVEMGRRVKEFVLQLETLTRERDAQEALIRQQQDMIAGLQETIQKLEEDSDKFVASNQRLRAQLGEINELVPVPSSEPSSSSGPINVLDSLKERLALYMQNMEQKQIALRELQEKDEQSQAVIQQWQVWFEEHLEELRQYEQEAETEINELRVALQQRQTELGDTDDALQEAIDDIESLEQQRDKLQAFVDKWVQDMRAKPQSASDTDTDTSMGVVSAPTVVARTEGIDLEAAAAVRTQREQERLNFVQRMQEAEEALVAEDEEYLKVHPKEVDDAEAAIKRKEEELKQRKEDTERRMRELEERESILEAKKPELEEKQRALYALKSNIVEREKVLSLKELDFEQRWAQLEEEKANAQRAEKFLEEREAIWSNTAETETIDTGMDTAMRDDDETRMRGYVATSAFTPDTPVFDGERTQGGGEMADGALPAKPKPHHLRGHSRSTTVFGEDLEFGDE